MAPRPSIVVAGLPELRRDLRKIDKSLDVEVRKEMRTAVEPVRAEAARRAPRGTRPIPRSRRPRKRLADSLGIRVTTRRVSIVSSLRHAKVVHGLVRGDGSIKAARRPLKGDRSGPWIAVPPRPFIRDADNALAERTVERLAEGIDRALTRNGFH